VLIYTPNIFESLVVNLACARIGAIPFMIDSVTHQPYDLAQHINVFKPKVAFVVSHATKEFDDFSRTTQSVFEEAEAFI
jgi:acyl-coenzyme A synthetase/AMP-(fatty) acid ligase